jgi:phosphoribosylformylglycinamidine synthase subunit PurQ / glutaminase
MFLIWSKIFDMVKELGHTPQWLWCEEEFKTDSVDSIILPGGFSYGDYLRCGALAARSPAMKSVKAFAEQGKPVLGICNGFQILCESGLLPGVLVRNKNLKFIDKWVDIKIENPNKFFGSKFKKDQVIKIPVAHGEGCYFIPEEQRAKLKPHQIWVKYLDNPNGSFNDIAGVSNEAGNVAALMPHPERALHIWMGSDHGRNFL